MTNIITWHAPSNSGAFQKAAEIGIFSDMITVKPTFSFKFTSMEYVEQANLYTIDGIEMSDEQKAECLAYINAVTIPMEWYRNVKKSHFTGAYQNAINTMTGGVDSAEMASWTKQESEARAWNTDNNTPTPLIDALLAGRNANETKQELVDKILSKADQYAAAYAYVLGQYQMKLKSLEACTTTEEVLAL